MARDVLTGVVLFRQSHLRTYVFRLDLGRDMHRPEVGLTLGARFYGRFFPERCDLSFDGKYFVYFAMMGRRTAGNSGPQTWTAVCTPPKLTALVFCPNGSTWGGGGVFIDRQRLILRDQPEKPVSPGTLEGIHVVTSKELAAVEQQALVERLRPTTDVIIPNPLTTHRRVLPYLRKRRVPGVSSGYDMWTYTLQDSDGSDLVGAEQLALATSAQWDGLGRLVVGRGGFLDVYPSPIRRKLPEPVHSIDLAQQFRG